MIIIKNRIEINEREVKNCESNGCYIYFDKAKDKFYMLIQLSPDLFNWRCILQISEESVFFATHWLASALNTVLDAGYTVFYYKNFNAFVADKDAIIRGELI